MEYLRKYPSKSLSKAGKRHSDNNEENQDAVLYRENDEKGLVFIGLANGVSDCPKAKEGAQLAVNELARLLLVAGHHFFDYDDESRKVLILRHLQYELKKKATEENSKFDDYSSTISGVLMDKKNHSMLTVNLGSSIILGRIGKQIKVISQAGRSRDTVYSTTHPLELAAKKMKSSVITGISENMPAFEEIFIMSDGAWENLFKRGYLDPGAQYALQKGNLKNIEYLLSTMNPSDDYSIISLASERNIDLEPKPRYPKIIKEYPSQNFSNIGERHSKGNQENQDAVIHEENKKEGLVFIGLADGVSSCSKSKEGAQLAIRELCRLLVNKGRKLFEFNDETRKELILRHLQNELKKLAEKEGNDFEDYSSTLAGVLIDKRNNEMFTLNLGNSIIFGVHNNQVDVVSFPGDKSAGIMATTTPLGIAVQNTKTRTIPGIAGKGPYYEKVYIMSDGAWTHLFNRSQLYSKVRHYLSIGDLKSLNDFIKSKNPRDDQSVISLVYDSHLSQPFGDSKSEDKDID